MLLLAVQGAVYYQGRTVAMAAAQDGARGAAAFRATDADGRSAALAFARKAGGEGLLERPEVRIERDQVAGTVTVEVRGTTMSLVPGWDPTVEQSSTRPIEEFTGAEDSGGGVTW
jgi:hypothetical protein